MGFMDSLKKTAAVTKLQGELLLLDREIKACKESQGVLIYDILAKRQNSVDEDAKKVPLPAGLDGLEAAFLATTANVHELNQKRNKVVDQMELLEEAKSGRNAGSTAGEKASYVGSVIKDNAQGAKLKTELAYFDREIKVRQGVFGVQVFDELHLMDVAASASDDGTFPQDDANVGEVLNQAVAEMKAVLNRKQAKEDEIKAAKET